MLRLEDVERLAEYKSESGVLSLYLTTGRGLLPQGEYMTVFKSLSDSFKDHGGDIRRIEKFLEHEFEHKAKGIVVFSDVENEFWRAFELQVPVPNWLLHETAPYIRPLIRLLEDHEKHLVVLVDKEKARFLVYHLGEIEEYLEIQSEVKGRHKQGGRSQARLQRQHWEQVTRHLKAVAKRMDAVFKGEGFDRLVVGSTTPEIRPVLEGLLQPRIRERLGAWFDVELFAGSGQVLEMVRELEGRLEAEQERIHLEALKNSIGPSKTAVTGLDDTLTALQEGRLSMLLIKKGVEAAGMACASCGYLHAEPPSRCPVCEGESDSVNDIIDSALRVAMNRGVTVSYVEGDEEFESLGGIGGLLRF